MQRWVPPSPATHRPGTPLLGLRTPEPAWPEDEECWDPMGTPRAGAAAGRGEKVLELGAPAALAPQDPAGRAAPGR